MVRVLFVRHGESIGNSRRILQGWLDLPLTAKGLEQAQQVAAALAGIGPIAAVYASPLRRAASTAAEIARRVGVGVESDPNLREHDVGDATGLTWKEFAARFPEWADRVRIAAIPAEPDELYPNGERTSEFRERCRRAIARIVNRHLAGTIVVVSHSGVIAWGLAYLLDPESADWPGYELPNGSISEVVVEGGRARLMRVGDVRHLDGSSDQSL